MRMVLEGGKGGGSYELWGTSQFSDWVTEGKRCPTGPTWKPKYLPKVSQSRPKFAIPKASEKAYQKYIIEKVSSLRLGIKDENVRVRIVGGFIFASTVSYILKKPLVLLRKKNKLPAERHSVDFQLEYGEATIEVHKDSIEKGDKVLILDDLIATGGTAEAAAKLIEMSGGKVAGFIFIINLFDLPGDSLLRKKSYFTHSLIKFPGH